MRAAVAGAWLCACVAGCSSARHRTIAEENALPGDNGWVIDDGDADPAFGVYARPLSLERGQRLAVFVSAPAATAASYTVYRIGWYGGAGGRRYAAGNFDAGPQSPPQIDPTTGLVECAWTESFGVRIGDDWTPGYHLVRVQLADGRVRYAPFIVKDRRHADVLAVLPTATDEAYNDWGGESLYTDTRFGFPVGHAYEVSYDRPFAQAFGAGVSFASSLPAVRWLEANGYDVTYLADHDVGSDAETLTRARLAMTLAHDEYWSRAMRDHYDAARDAGVSLAFLGANTAFWQVRFEPGPDGLPDRRQIGYKEAADLDPLRHVDDADVTAAFAGPILHRPENALLGVRSLDWFMIDFPWAVRNASSWVYAGSGLAEDEILPGLIGIEADAVSDNGATPAGIQPLAFSASIGGTWPTIDHAEATVYDTAAGGFVFDAASIRFPATLQGARSVAGAQRMVANLIARATSQPIRDEVLQARVTFANADWSTAASQVQTVAGVPGQAGYVDGPAAQAKFSAPLGLAVAPDGALLIVDAGNYRIRRLDPPEAGAARAVTTLVGTEPPPNDGRPLPPGVFLHAWGVAVAPDGAAWVTDPNAHRVTRIGPGGDLRVIDEAAVGSPTGVAVAADGTVWLVDQYDGGVRTIAPDGSIQKRTVTYTDAPLSFPSGIALDGSTAFIVDSGHRAIRALAPDGSLTTLAGGFADSPFVDGNGRVAGLEPLLGLVKVGAQWIVADAGNYRLRVLSPGATSMETRVGSWAGRSARFELVDGRADQAELGVPTGLAWDAARGLVYVADSGNAAIRVITP